jgi:hypothetical protein
MVLLAVLAKPEVSCCGAGQVLNMAAVEVVVGSITVLSTLLLQPVDRVAVLVAMQTLQRTLRVRLVQPIAVAVVARDVRVTVGVHKVVPAELEQLFSVMPPTHSMHFLQPFLRYART